jgi:PAS domain S-box-containing protein
MLVGWSFAASAAGANAPLPLLTNIAQIHSLTPEQADLQYPARVQGVITAFYMERSLAIQSDDEGLWIQLNDTKPETAKVGQVVLIEGVSGPGSFLPIVTEARLSQIGIAPLPSPVRLPNPEIPIRKLDCRWAETTGIVRSTFRNPASPRVAFCELDIGMTRLMLQMMWETNQPLPTYLIDAKVAVRGIALSEWNKSRQLRGFSIYAPGTNYLTIVEPAPEDPFAIPVRLAHTVFRAETEETTLGHRRQVQGVVLYQIPGEMLFIRDATGGFLARIAATEPVHPGDFVAVVGFPEIGDYSPSFVHAIYRSIRSGPPPMPIPVTETNLLAGDYDADLVSLEAHLLGTTPSPDKQVLTLQAGDTVFNAELPVSKGAAHPLAILPNGSQLRLTGIARLKAEPTAFSRIHSFQLLVRSVDDIQLLRRPPWWSTQYLLSALGILTPLVLGALFWITSLRRQILERRQVERELQQQKDFLRRVLDANPTFIFVKDRAGRFTLANQAIARFFGLTVEQMIGKTDADLVPDPATVKQFQDDDRTVMDTRQEKFIPEEKAINQHQDVVWLQTVKCPLLSANGKADHVLGVSTDITARKRVEELLAHERDLLRALMDHVPDCIYFKDLKSRFIRCSRSMAERFHLPTPDKAVGKTDFDFFTLEHAQPAYEAERQIIRTGQPVIGLLEQETWKHGQITWSLTTKMPFRDKEGKMIGTFGISRDVTALKQAQIELAYERDLLRALMDTVPDRIYFKDRQSRFVRCSREVARVLDLDQDQILGKTDFDLFSKEHAQPAYDAEQQIIRTGEPLIGLVEKEVWPDGHVTWALTTKMPWRDPQGDMIGTFGVSRDITDLKEAEENVERVHQQVIEISRQAGMAEVATTVLHNVGNVLNSANVSANLVVDNLRKSRLSSLTRVVELIHDHAQELGRFFTEDDQGRQLPEYLEILAQHLAGEQAELLREINSLTQHIEHIKEIVATQQNYAQISGIQECLPLADLVEDALRMNAVAYARQDVRLVREFTPVPPVMVDKHKVLQILINLLRNARYACDESGRPDKQVIVRIAPQADNRVIVQVADNGVGITPENLTKIFSYGFTTRKHGHGFGLHSGALAAKELGGSLTVYSDGPGKGATFTLHLPTQTAPPPNQPQG